MEQKTHPIPPTKQKPKKAGKKLAPKLPAAFQADLFSENLLTHWNQHARPLPWRQNKDPYRIWLSEIMLQQTTVATVGPYFANFLKQFPTLQHLAKAKQEGVLAAWQGLGYYSRARNLHTCAQHVATNLNGQFPRQEAELRQLPGIGPYTAAAIAAIAFGQNATVVDGNVERIISRLFCVKTPLPTPAAKHALKGYAAALTPQKNSGNFAEAMMDLGATICTPRAPKCPQCPVAKFCQAHKAGTAEAYPKKQPKKQKETRHGVVFVLQNAHGEIYLQQRPQKGLLAGLWQLPNQGGLPPELPLPTLCQPAATACAGNITHTFTHFTLNWEVRTLKGLTTTPANTQLAEGFFSPNNLPPMPTLMKKALAAAGLAS